MCSDPAAAQFLQNSNTGQKGNINEQQLMQSHDKVNQGGEAHSDEIGQAAARVLVRAAALSFAASHADTCFPLASLYGSLAAIKQFIGDNSGGSSGGDFQQKVSRRAFL